jgi:hypothetical protein
VRHLVVHEDIESGLRWESQSDLFGAKYYRIPFTERAYCTTNGEPRRGQQVDRSSWLETWHFGRESPPRLLQAIGKFSVHAVQLFRLSRKRSGHPFEAAVAQRPSGNRGEDLIFGFDHLRAE